VLSLPARPPIMSLAGVHGREVAREQPRFARREAGFFMVSRAGSQGLSAVPADTLRRSARHGRAGVRRMEKGVAQR
jgi:hypothetical protein